jgi:hypothetical protein
MRLELKLLRSTCICAQETVSSLALMPGPTASLSKILSKISKKQLLRSACICVSTPTLARCTARNLPHPNYQLDPTDPSPNDTQANVAHGEGVLRSHERGLASAPWQHLSHVVVSELTRLM